MIEIKKMDFFGKIRPTTTTIHQNKATGRRGKKKNPISTLKIATKNGTHSKSSSMNSPFGNNLCVIGAFNERVICLSETSKPGMICETRARVCGGHHRVKTISFLKLYKFWKSGVIYVCSNLLYNYLNLITVFF